MIRRPPRSTHCISSAASDVYKRQFPLGLERGDVDDDAATRIRALAQADGEHAARDAEVLDRACQRKAVGRDDAHVAVDVDKTFLVEILGVDHGAVDVGEHLAVSYTHLRAHETAANLVCRLLLEKKFF